MKKKEKENWCMERQRKRIDVWKEIKLLLVLRNYFSLLIQTKTCKSTHWNVLGSNQGTAMIDSFSESVFASHPLKISNYYSPNYGKSISTLFIPIFLFLISLSLLFLFKFYWFSLSPLPISFVPVQFILVLSVSLSLLFPFLFLILLSYF